jgi:hypothetical protein
MKKMKILLFVLALLSIQFVNAATYYVSPNGVSTNTGTQTSPWPIQYAANQTVAGDIVYFLTGTYNFTGLTINNSGTSSSYITYSAAPGASPVLQCENPCQLWNAINVQASYIKIEGLELIGNNANITLAFAEQIYAEALAGGTDWARYAQTNTNGITIGNSSIIPTHIEVRNCKVHDFAGAGIAAIDADYLIVENNIVYNTCWYNMYAGSGISFLSLQNTTSSTDFINIIRNNVVYNNKGLVKWIQTQTYSDGNGIILDSFNHDWEHGVKAYTGKTLVENNLIYLNGGSGTYVMSSANVTFRNNISYWNSTETAQGTGAGELVCYDAQNITWVNNIAVANPAYGSEVYAINDNGAWGSNSAITWKNNLSFNGTVGQSSVNIAKTTTTSLDGSNLLGANPLFVNTATKDFHLQLTSPGINSGTDAYGVATTDLDGNPRLKGIIDMGCYENPAASTNINPTVSITSPVNNTEIDAPASITINATAADADGTVTKVEFYQGTTLLGTDLTSPYSFTWSNVAIGNYALNAKAYDNDNSTATSAFVTVFVIDPSLTDILIQAESCNLYSAGITIGSDKISGLYVGTWVQYNNINLGSGYNYLQTYGTARNDGVAVEVHLDSPTGPIVGRVDLLTNKNKNILSQGILTGASGVHNICLVGLGTYGTNLDYIMFTNNSLKSAMIPTNVSSVESGINIYPNPVTNGELTVSFSENQNNAVISIFDLQGKELYKKASAGSIAFNINTSSFLKAGIYIIKVQDENLNETHKLIIE